MAAALATTILIAAAPRDAGAINCAFGAHPPATDGNWVYGHSSMDCYSFQTDWLTGLLYEKFLGVDIQRDVDTNNTNSAGWIHAYTAYYCNGHGTDDWVEKSQGRDLGGNQSGILSGPTRSLIC